MTTKVHSITVPVLLGPFSGQERFFLSFIHCTNILEPLHSAFYHYIFLINILWAYSPRKKKIVLVFIDGRRNKNLSKIAVFSFRTYKPSLWLSIT
jgi:hypothetical protein